MNLRTARKLIGLTQEQLADRARLSGQQISNLECGCFFPHQATRDRIARVLNQKINWYGHLYENREINTDMLFAIVNNFISSDVERAQLLINYIQQCKNEKT